MTIARSVTETFQPAASRRELCELAVHGLKAMTGYDRVMAYQFAEDGHGEVIAEARAAHLTPYLGQHYPATDIPPQVRRLYLRQRVGMVADASYQPVPLLTDPTQDDGMPLDLTHSALRSISPIHRAYMRNMKTAASLTVGLGHGQDLWGMLVCHHGTPRVTGPEMRAAVDMIGQVVSLLLSSLGEVELFAHRLERSATLRALVDHLAAPLPLPEAFAAAAEDLLELVNAAGAVVRCSGSVVRLGRTPPAAAVELAFDILEPEAGSDVLAVDELGLRHKELAGGTPDASGALLLPLTPAGDAIMWFRPELSRTLIWGGNPNEHAVSAGPLSPRASFAAWKQTVSGRSAPWTEADLALARELRSAVSAEVARRTQAALWESEARFRLLAEHSGDVVILNDMDGTRRYVSPAAERVLGWRPEDLVGRNALEFVHPEDQPALRDAFTAMQGGTVETLTCYRLRRPDGSWLWVEGLARAQTTAEGAGPRSYVVVLRDATERKAAEVKLRDALDRMERMAATDGLTGLANRRHLDEVADREWRRCARDHLPLSVLLLDFDHFKLFNDRYGHLAGDGCLRAIASQLDAAARRPCDLAARYGGEEFVLLMPTTNQQGALVVAEGLCRRVRNLRIPHDGNSVEGVVTISIGAATAWPDACESAFGSIDALLSAADAALYQAKRGGRNRVEVAGRPSAPN
jgi:diguanylate cyclase (GGDEF)-like protein/PAS domain S-box-containing protein